MTKTLSPVGHRILVKPEKVEEISAGGIVLPKQQVDREQAGTERGVVLATGPDAWYDKPSQWCKPGDAVYFVRYAGHQIDGDDYGYPGETLRIMDDQDVLGVVASQEAA